MANIIQKTTFFIKLFLKDCNSRSFILSISKAKILSCILLKVPSPYQPIGYICSVEQWFKGSLPKEMKGSKIKPVIPESSISLKKPYHLKNDLHPAFLKDDDILHFPKMYLCYFKNARIVTENGVIISYDNKVFADFTFELGKSIEQHNVFKTYINKHQLKNDCLATITSAVGVGYFHWMFDCLPRLKLLEDSVEKIDCLIVPPKLKKFHIESLSYLNYSVDKLFYLKKTDHFMCTNLLVPSFPGKSGYIPKWACIYLRNKFLPNNIHPYRLIYISRKDAIVRKLINENEIETYLKGRGFEIIEMSTHSFLEQVKICAEAKIVVGPHGAGLSNTVFCQNAKIIELFSPSYVNVCYWRLSNVVSNEYHYIIGDETSGYPLDEWKDFRVDINKLKHLLNLII